MLAPRGGGVLVMSRFVIEGGSPLQGVYPIQGNKNAALPLLAAALLTSQTRLEGVPRIRDVENMIRIIEALGARVDWEDEGLQLTVPAQLEPHLPRNLVFQLRGSVLLLGVLLPQVGELEAPLPGGCPIGRRSLETHWRVFRAAGYEVEETFQCVRIKRVRRVAAPRVYLPEASVTATENALLLFAREGGVIENPAREPHVLDLVKFLQGIGVGIALEPCRFVVEGWQGPPRSMSFRVPPDYIDAGTAAIAALVTGGRLDLRPVSRRELLGIAELLEMFGARITWRQEGVVVERERPELVSPGKITAAPWPGFPTDLTSLAVVLATQARGQCLIHDWLYESRMFFVDKLVRMGANLTLCDPHRVLVAGPTRLRGTRLESPDIRAGMALLVAGLCAEGTTVIEHAEVVERGYQAVTERFAAVGARITEVH